MTSGDLTVFVAAVRLAAVAAAEHRAFGSKVWINDVWNELDGDVAGELLGYSEARFKSALIEAMRAGLIKLSRCDLTPAFPQRLVEDSEVTHSGWAYHFVRL